MPARCSHPRSVSSVSYAPEPGAPLILSSFIEVSYMIVDSWAMCWDQKTRRKWLISRTDLSRRERYPIERLYKHNHQDSVCQCLASRDPSKFDLQNRGGKIFAFNFLSSLCMSNWVGRRRQFPGTYGVLNTDYGVEYPSSATLPHLPFTIYFIQLDRVRLSHGACKPNIPHLPLSYPIRSLPTEHELGTR